MTLWYTKYSWTKKQIILKGIVFKKQGKGWDLSGKPKEYSKCEPKRETNCRFSIPDNQTNTVNSGYKRVPFHFSGPKGRRFKSCHLDQKPEQNVTFCPVFFYALHTITGLYRIVDISDTPGQQRILSDKCTLCPVPGTEPVSFSHNQTRPKGSNHHLEYDNSGLFTGLVSSQTAI